MELKFRTLTASEIECKAEVIKNMIEISLHSKAATCTRILNESVGAMNWEKEYTNGNKNCIVRIWDVDKNRMISKEDCGGPLTEIDGHKGQASNGFKRVCALGWGLGIELYSQPKITFPRTDDNTIYDAKNGMIVSEKYVVKEIEYDANKHITHVVICKSDGVVVYDGPDENGKSTVKYPVPEEILIIPEDADMQGLDEEDKELPDNTDGFDELSEDGDMQPTPFGCPDYRKEIEQEIKRTHVKRSDVLKTLNITSFEDLEKVDEIIINKVINKLRMMKTYEH